MKIEFEKTTNYQHTCKIIRDNNSIELISLDTKTYFVHDICHYVVERNLRYSKGFWDMLSLGHSFMKLVGKDNPQTIELRFIEQIVGSIQSVYLGYMPKLNFDDSIRHLDFSVSENVLNACLNEIDTLIENWRQLSVGQQLTLEWNLSLKN